MSFVSLFYNPNLEFLILIIWPSKYAIVDVGASVCVCVLVWLRRLFFYPHAHWIILWLDKPFWNINVFHCNSIFIVPLPTIIKCYRRDVWWQADISTLLFVSVWSCLGSLSTHPTPHTCTLYSASLPSGYSRVVAFVINLYLVG